MLKEDLVKKMSDSSACYGLSKRRIKEILDEALRIISESLTNGEGILLRGFGQFHVDYQKPYLINHPTSGKQIMSHPRYRVKFEPARNVKKELRLNERPDKIQPIQPESKEV